MHQKIMDQYVFHTLDYQRRIQKLQEQLMKSGNDLYLMAGGTNMEYFTGLKHQPHDRLVLIGIGAQNDPFLICPEFETETLKEHFKLPIHTVYTWCEYEDPFKLCAQVFSGLKTKLILMDEHFPYWQFNSIAQNYATASYNNAKQITTGIRAIKSLNEQACIRKANEISLQVHETALDHLYEGMKMSELDAIYEQLHIENGCTEPWGGGSFGIASSFIHGTIQDIQLEEGMVILADAGAKYNGYFSDVSRTVVFGKASQEVKDAWEIAQISQIAGIQALKAGNPCEMVDLSIRMVLEKAGYSPSYTYLPHRVGHGIGLDIHEEPFLVEGNKTPLKEDMVVAFDGAFYIHNKFGIRLEDNFIVTADGCEVLGHKLAHSIDLAFGK